MVISATWAVIPGSRTLLTAVLSSLLGGRWRSASPPRSSDPPLSPHDPRFVEIGRAYLPGLGKAHAAAREEGVRSLEADQPIADANATVGKAWDANRTQLFDPLATPEFAGIVPESQNDADVTTTQRAAMGAASRWAS